MGTRAMGNPLPMLGRGVGQRQRRSIANSFVTCALVFGALGALVLEVPDRGHDPDPSSQREGELGGRGPASGGAQVAYAEPVTGEGSAVELVHEEARFEGERNLGGGPALGWNPLLLWLALAGIAGATIGAMAGAVTLVRGGSRHARGHLRPVHGQRQVAPERPIIVTAS